MEKKLPEPGSAARSAEERPSTPNRKIEPGSAARIAEQSAHETTAVPRDAFRGTLNIRTRATSGVKFEFASKHEGPGEALPEGYKAQSAAPVEHQPAVNLDSNAESKEPQAGLDSQGPAGGGWGARLRKLFGR